VQFGTLASALVVDSGAVFNGAIGGFKANDTVDITNLTPTQVAADFNSATHVFMTASDGTLHFTSSFSEEYFVFSSDGGTGTDVTLATDPVTTTLLYTLTLGSASSPLTITNTGAVAPAAAGATGVISSLAADVLTNNGVISGGAGRSGSAGSNSAGGSGGAGGNGGVGVNESAGALTNNHEITGRWHWGQRGHGRQWWHRRYRRSRRCGGCALLFGCAPPGSTLCSPRVDSVAISHCRPMRSPSLRACLASLHTPRPIRVPLMGQSHVKVAPARKSHSF
jgi:hypothetical protein